MSAETAARRCARPRATMMRATTMMLVIGSLLWPGTAAVATPDGATGRMVFKLAFDGRGAVRDGTVFKNQAGKGRVTVKHGEGRFKRVKGKPGRALRYPVDPGYGLLEGPDRKAWDPGGRDFRFGAKVKIPRSQATRHMNVIQKGYFKQTGGQWKLQIDAGLPSCVIRGGVDRVLVRGSRSVIDGRWHQLTCSRTAENGVRLFVDGRWAAGSNRDTGNVSNGAPLRVGAKKLGTGQVDQFHGRLDVPFLHVGPPAT